MIKRLMKELSMKDNHKLKNIKFVLGNNRNITQKELIDEAVKALSQIMLGDSEKVEYVDSGFNKLTVEEFLR